MEPISIIVSALAAGAAKAAGEAAPDAYNALKALIKRKFAGEPKADLNPEIKTSFLVESSGLSN